MPQLRYKSYLRLNSFNGKVGISVYSTKAWTSACRHVIKKSFAIAISILTGYGRVVQHSLYSAGFCTCMNKKYIDWNLLTLAHLVSLNRLRWNYSCIRYLVQKCKGLFKPLDFEYIQHSTCLLYKVKCVWTPCIVPTIHDSTSLIMYIDVWNWSNFYSITTRLFLCFAITETTLYKVELVWTHHSIC